MQSEPQSPKPADEMRAPAEWNRPPPKAKPNETSFESSATLTRPALYIVGTYLSIGTLLFSALEGWGLSTSIYFCVITLTTVGYGDVVPKTAANFLHLCKGDKGKASTGQRHALRVMAGFSRVGLSKRGF